MQTAFLREHFAPWFHPQHAGVLGSLAAGGALLRWEFKADAILRLRRALDQRREDRYFSSQRQHESDRASIS